MTCKIHDDAEQDTALADGLCPLCLSAELTALRSPAPAATVTDALIKAGIELHNIVDDDLAGQKWACENWRKALAEYEKSTQPALTDAMLLVVMKAAESWLQNGSFKNIYDLCLQAALRSAVAAVRGAGGEGE